MEKKNRYLYYSIFYSCLLIVVIGIYAFGYNPPTCDPPGCNLPAPINTGPNSQTKEGNLTIGGNLTTGSFTMTAGAGADKVLTTNASGTATWQEAGGGWDGVLPNYTTAQRNALSLVDGLIVFNTTDNAVQIYKSGAWANVGAKLSLAATCSLDGDCDSTHCVDGVCCDTACSGLACQTCGALSSAGLGNCGYVNNNSPDPHNICTTATPPTVNSCKSPNCSGTGYTCGYLSGEASQPTCKRCTGSSYDPANIANATQDAEGTNLCTAAHYRCNGSGLCTAPCNTTCGYYASCGNPPSCANVAMCTSCGGTGCAPYPGACYCNCYGWLY